MSIFPDTNPIEIKSFNFVPISRKINGKMLSGDIDISATDLGAYSKEETQALKLANPNKLTFTGIASGEYDGSIPVAIDIPKRYLDADVNYYVSTTGSDTLGDGTQENPFASINKAVSMLPCDLNKRLVLIHVQGGNYSGDINIISICQSTLTILIESITVLFDTTINIINAHVHLHTQNNTLIIQNTNKTCICVRDGQVDFQGVFNVVSNTGVALYAGVGGRINIDYGCSLGINNSNTAVHCDGGLVTMREATLGGQGNNIGFNSMGDIRLNNPILAASILYMKSKGGTIVQGAGIFR